MAFQQTCRAIAQLTRYLLDNCGFKYILLGLIQSDNIEARFGWYRQLSGANYFISMRQLTESEKKIRAISLLKFSGFTVRDIDAVMTKKDSSKDTERLAADIHAELLFTFIPSEHDQKIVYYICGACARSVFRTKHCVDCKEALTLEKIPSALSIDNEDVPEAAAFVQEINRGGLLCPQEHIFNLGILCWRVFFEIKETESLKHLFLMCQHHRQLFCDIMDIVVGENFDIFFGKTFCTKGHNIAQEMAARFFNTMAKNFVKDVSSLTTHNDARKRQRKALKLSGNSSNQQ